MPFVRRSALVCAVALAVCSSPAFAADGTVEIKLTAMGGSREVGVAILTPKGEKTLVELKMTNAPAEPQPAHFHTGTCDNYNPRPLYQLRAVTKGESTTTIDAPIDKLLGGDLVVNVHKSFDDIATIVSCAISKKV